MLNCIRVGVFYFCLIMASIYTSFLYAAMQDPTRPSGYVGDENTNVWQLSAIFIYPNRRVAIIDGISVKVGDEISGQRVVAIESDSVMLDGSNGKMVLYLINKNLKHISK